jgi:hypothetical protein
MAPIDAALQGWFWQTCGGVAVGFLCLIFVLALTRKLFGVLENDEDWNG